MKDYLIINKDKLAARNIPCELNQSDLKLIDSLLNEHLKINLDNQKELDNFPRLSESELESMYNQIIKKIKN